MTAQVDQASRPGIAELGLGFCSAKILLSALELGVFTALAEGPLSHSRLCTELGLHGRGAQDFLDALVGLGLLERTETGYRNSERARRGLVHGPDYQAAFLDGANFVLYPAWGGLTDALRTGAAQASGEVDDMLSDPQRQQVYLAMMDALSQPLAGDLARCLDWREFSTIADIGGARGNMLALLLREHPHLAGTVVDRPQNAQACAEHVSSLGVGDRVRFRGGDFFTEELPAADVLILGHVLADFSPDERAALVAKASRAVRPGGALLVYDPMPDESAPRLESLVASLHMLVMTPSGSGYRPAECAGWLHRAGLAHTSVHPLDLGNTLVIGRKAA